MASNQTTNENKLVTAKSKGGVQYYNINNCENQHHYIIY